MPNIKKKGRKSGEAEVWTQLKSLSMASLPRVSHCMKNGKVVYNQYDIGRRGCALMSSLLKANWNGQASGHK
jgi:hypothetical protein